MPRFVVRYRGQGARPQDAVDRVRRIEGASILDDSDRTMLVDASEEALRGALTPETDWIIAPEVAYPVPDTRKRVQSSPKTD